MFESMSCLSASVFPGVRRLQEPCPQHCDEIWCGAASSVGKLRLIAYISSMFSSALSEVQEPARVMLVLWQKMGL